MRLRSDRHIKKIVWRCLNKRQEAALASSEFEVFCGGERGGGKSEIGMMWLIEPEYASHPDYRCLVLRKNSVDLADWIYRFRKFATQFIPGIEIGGNPTTIKFPSGGMGTLGHLSNKDSWSHYVGHEYQRILFEEINLIPDEARYLMILGSCRSTIPELAPQCLSSGNPGNVGHAWVKARFVDKAREKTYIDPQSGLSRIFIPLKLRENTKLPASYEQTLRLLPVQIQKAWIDGDWDALAGMFFTSMPETVEPHSIETWDLNLYGSFDFGCSEKGHSSFGMWQLRQDGRPERLFTWYHKLGHIAGEQAQELIDYVKSFPWTHGRLPQKVFADPAIFAKKKEIGLNQSPRAVADYFNDVFGEGVFVPANNSRANGWVVVRDYFGLYPLTKEAKCLVWDGYNQTFFDMHEVQIHDPDNPDDIAPNDLDHVVDENRYGLVSFHSMGKPDARGPEEAPEFPAYVDTNYSDTAWMA